MATVHVPVTMNAMVDQAIAAVKVNSKSVVLVQLDRVDQVHVQAGTLDQVVTHARAETHVQLAILAELTAHHLVTHVKIATNATTADRQVLHAIATSAMTVDLLVHLVNVLTVMIAELRLLGELARKATVVHRVRVSTN